DISSGPGTRRSNRTPADHGVIDTPTSPTAGINPRTGCASAHGLNAYGRRLRLARRYPPRRSAPGADRQQVRAAVEAGYQHIEHAQRLALATEYHARWVT
ncbi:MAG TPA: hypothetical protein VK784_03615, partial [Pseudonocardiaceae bacterium]|nr:hypothetical protein [Pseudonocardiaceae bacterium]